jgi:hypothetical protein
MAWVNWRKPSSDPLKLIRSKSAPCVVAAWAIAQRMRLCVIRWIKVSFSTIAGVRQRRVSICRVVLRSSKHISSRQRRR